MKEQLSDKMKKLSRFYGSVAAVAILYCLALAFLLAGIGMKVVGMTRSDENPSLFDVYGEPEQYSKLEVQLLSYEFASDFKETNHYYFGFDSQATPYIILIHGDLSEECAALRDYFYSDVETGQPKPVVLSGMSARIEDDVKEFAIESYNEMWGEDIIDADNFSEYFGSVCLDTSRHPVSALERGAAVPFLIALALAVAGTALAVVASRKVRTTRATLEKFPPEKLAVVDGQLNRAALSFEAEKLYLTDQYVISGVDGLVILPYETINRVYDCAAGAGKRRIMAETMDQKPHTLGVIKTRGSARQERFVQILSQVKRRISEQKAMRSEVFARSAEPKEPMEDESMPVGMDQSVSNQQSQSFEASAATEAVKPSSNMLPGLIGAVFGSLVGVVLWVIIGQVGFIAGIAGFVILKFALSGYAKLGRSVDKKGALSCLVIAAVMIFGANILDYVVSIARVYFEYEASFETFFYVLANFGSLMDQFDMWNNFFINLAIGYGLSIWSSSRAIGAILKL